VPAPAIHRAVRIAVGEGVELEADVRIPSTADGVVVFAHGSGSSRFSRRNRFVAGRLEAAGFGTLLLDLLTAAEAAIDEPTGEYRFDVAMLGRRVVGAIDWLQGHRGAAGAIALFGASTGAAAALIAAAERPDAVRAVISRGGRPDLAATALPLVRAPTLLIVGGHDVQVADLNRRAVAQMRAEVRLDIVPGATHLFEEPGTLGVVAEHARTWFVEHGR
jgi:putative phosphoribosyl transferase